MLDSSSTTSTEGCSFMRRPRGRAARKIYGKPGTLPGSGIHQDEPAVRLDRALDDREPKPAAPGAPRHERLEEARAHVRVDAGPVVAHLQPDRVVQSDRRAEPAPAGPTVDRHRPVPPAGLHGS
jgi:hypothetical protein